MQRRNLAYEVAMKKSQRVQVMVSYILLGPQIPTIMVLGPFGNVGRVSASEGGQLSQNVLSADESHLEGLGFRGLRV